MSMAEPKATRMYKKRSDELQLANVLIAPFHPFAGAPEEVVAEEEMEGRTDGGKACNALELAIVTEAKIFISVRNRSIGRGIVTLSCIPVRCLPKSDRYALPLIASIEC
jgi:hypothetical protein